MLSHCLINSQVLYQLRHTPAMNRKLKWWKRKDSNLFVPQGHLVLQTSTARHLCRTSTKFGAQSRNRTMTREVQARCTNRYTNRAQKLGAGTWNRTMTSALPMRCSTTRLSQHAAPVRCGIPAHDFWSPRPEVKLGASSVSRTQVSALREPRRPAGPTMHYFNLRIRR